MVGSPGLSTGSPQLITRMNAAAVVNLVRREGPISRVDIARELGLSAATISRLIGELLEAQIVIESDLGASRGGRRPVLLTYNPRAALLVGVDVGGTKITGALSDLDGHLVAKVVVPTWPEDGSAQGIDAVYKVIETLLATQAELGVPVRGIGIGVPGVSRHQEGVVVWSPGLRWRELPLATLIQERFTLPTFLDNDVNLATFGEYWRGAGQEIDQLVGIFIGTGIGAGIILQGQILRGANEAAGEVGYFLLDRRTLNNTYPGFGAFESAVAGPGIAKRARIALEQAETPSCLRGTATPTSRAVLAAAAAGDPLATRMLTETLDDLALAIGNIACVLNPQRLILGGAVGLALAPWYSALSDRITGRIPHLPEIVGAALGIDAGLYGAIALAHERTNAEAILLSN